MVASSIPVALLANIARITLTGILHDTVGGHAASTFYHDLAGWLMIPLALILYWFEIWILSRILIETKYEAPLVLDLGGSKRPANAVQPRPRVTRHRFCELCRSDATDEADRLRMRSDSSPGHSRFSEESVMKPESHSHGELARPVATPAAIFAAETQQRRPGSSAAPVRIGEAGRCDHADRDEHSAGPPTPAVAGVGCGDPRWPGVCGPAAWFLVPPAKFKAQARLQVAAQPPKVLFRTVETGHEREDYRRYQNTQQTLVKSQLALNAALQDKEVSKYRMIREQVDPIAWLQENLKVEFIAASEVMEISLSGDNPHELAGIVNAVKKAYIDEVVNRGHQNANGPVRRAQEAQGAVRGHAEGAAGNPEEACPNGRVG